MTERMIPKPQLNLFDKRCRKCGEWKPVDEFYKDKSRQGGLSYQCKTCDAEAGKAYFRSQEGIITKIYQQQKRSSKERNHPEPEYSKQELGEWMFDHPAYGYLFARWQITGFKRDFTPSVDRKDNSKGYSFSNIRLVTWKMNDRLGCRDRSKPVNQYSKDGRLLQTYTSASEAERETGINNSSISKVCFGKKHQAGGFRWAFIPPNS